MIFEIFIPNLPQIGGGNRTISLAVYFLTIIVVYPSSRGNSIVCLLYFYDQYDSFYEKWIFNDDDSPMSQYWVS